MINLNNEEHLILYEMPLIADIFPFGFMQELIAKYIVWKIARKKKKLLRYLALRKYFSTNKR